LSSRNSALPHPYECQDSEEEPHDEAEDEIAVISLPDEARLKVMSQFFVHFVLAAGGGGGCRVSRLLVAANTPHTPFFPGKIHSYLSRTFSLFLGKIAVFIKLKAW